MWDQGFLITDPAPVEGSHGGAPAHLALRSSLRLVTRVNALRFCLSRLGPPPRVVVSGASMPPGYRPCVGSGFAAQVLGGWEPYLRSGSFLPAARFLVQRRDQRPVFLLIPPCCRSRVCCRHPSSNAGQRSVLLPILTGVLSRVAVVGEENSPFRSGGCRWGESGFSWASLERSQKYWWH